VNERPLLLVASAVIIAYTVLAFIDGLYLHLWKYRLHRHRQSIYEHKLHTLRAILFPLILYLLFAKNFGGILLWFGVLLAVTDLVIGMQDIFAEKSSRKELGGLSSFEYFIHVCANSLHVTYLTLIVLAKPVHAWSVSSPMLLTESYPSVMWTVFVLMVPGAAVGAVLHVWLLQAKYQSGL
jgi:hypothetical protein